MENVKKPYTPDLRDPSIVALVLSNILVIILALVQDWDFLTVLWVYWSQSVIIGILNYVKMVSARHFDVEGIWFNGRALANTTKSKLILSHFFVFHYGFFHAGYFFLLWFFSYIIPNIAGEAPMVHFQQIFLGATIFFLNHLYSYFQNMKKESQKIQNFRKLLFAPYIRILPMHLAFVIGLPMTMFLVLRSVVDVIMQNVENNLD